MKIYNVKSDNAIIVGEYPFHKELKEELLPLLENYPDQHDRSTNVKATMTEWEWQKDNRRVKRLKECACAELRHHPMVHQIGYQRYRKPSMINFKEFWANVYRKGDYTQSHDHLGYQTTFGFVYFLKTKWYHPPFTFSESGKKMKPKEGTYLIFPGYLKHHVLKNRFDETRITLSGNMLIKES
tara:strand:+ start:254 stop:802 length:549 start_codon:yes stop_codon:yes gene_type:complete